jgi:hypothetical protein
VLVFDLVVVVKAFVQLERSSEVLVFNLDAFLEVTVQFEQAMEVDEAFLERCLRLRLDCFIVAFSHVGVVVPPLNMVDARLRQMVSSLAGGCMSLHAIPSRNL